MNLVLDFGNTRIKSAIFDGEKMLKSQTFETEQQCIESLETSNIKKCIIGSVTGNHADFYNLFSSKFDTLVFKASTPIPLKNLYKTALSLGSDRIAASVGAFRHFPDKNVLTIDAGTCIKYNFVNADNEYLGGAISPGLNMRLKAMHEFTHALPLVKIDGNFSLLVGQTTQDSILSGALTASVCEVDGMIERYLQAYRDLQVVITGGDATYFEGQLKNRFFASQNILLEGLNTILNFNIEN